MKMIREYQATVLIIFIIVSILYGIHMFRYEFIMSPNDQVIIRYDRITNTQCLMAQTQYGLSAILEEQSGYEKGAWADFLKPYIMGEPDSLSMRPCWED